METCWESVSAGSRQKLWAVVRKVALTKKKKGLKKDRISRVRDVSPLSVKVLVLDGGNGSCVTLNESEYSRDICLTPKRTITHT